MGIVASMPQGAAAATDGDLRQDPGEWEERVVCCFGCGATVDSAWRWCPDCGSIELVDDLEARRARGRCSAEPGHR
jgi:hypothetical protein